MCLILEPRGLKPNTHPDPLAVLILLVENGAPRVVFERVCPDVPCPLVHAVEHHSTQAVQYLLIHSPYSSSTDDDNNARRRLEVVGASHPLSPSFGATIRGNKVEVVESQVRQGANINLPFNENDRFTPLLTAVEKDILEVVVGPCCCFRRQSLREPNAIGDRQRRTGMVYELLRHASDLNTLLKKKQRHVPVNEEGATTVDVLVQPIYRRRGGNTDVSITPEGHVDWRTIGSD